MMVNTDDGRGKNRFMRVDNRFEVGWVDVVATRDDDALETLSKVDEAVVGEIANIAGMEPEFAVFVELDSLGGLGFVTEVAHHD